MFIRVRNRILNENKTLYLKCDSVSAAKKASRELQAKGNKVTVDHSEDPKGKPLNFGRRHQYVSRAEQRRIEAMNARDAEKKREKIKADLLSPSQMKKVS